MDNGLYGWTGKILRIDLSNRKVTEEPIKKYADNYIGGMGIGMRILWDENSANVAPLDPDNRIVFMTGPITGTPAPTSGRIEVCTKAEGTEPPMCTRSGLGGSWGPELKFAGYDGLIVQGKADKPVYLLIQDGKAEIKDASHLWGKGAIEVRELLKGELGRDTRVAAIGAAGDNMATMANVIADEDSSGSSGFGAVMGSKQLKAIAVRASDRKVTAANPEKLQELYYYAWDSFYADGGYQIKMGELFMKVIEKEMRDGTYRRYKSKKKRAFMKQKAERK